MRTTLIPLVLTLLLAGGCAREDPEARLPGAYKRQLERAGQVEETLQEAAKQRLHDVDADY